MASGTQFVQTTVMSLLVAAMVCSSLDAGAEQTPASDRSVVRTHIDTELVPGKRIEYAVLLSPGYVQDKTYPLVLFLHGGGGSAAQLVQLAPRRIFRNRSSSSLLVACSMYFRMISMIPITAVTMRGEYSTNPATNSTAGHPLSGASSTDQMTKHAMTASNLLGRRLLRSPVLTPDVVAC
ncbi:MAG: hypothetical protein QGI68_07065 [Pseudomonadales bacterium]|jgi:hypothetical protein|nr:hypothetical protein [Pseudomonadales bacterium]MDP7595316.1 hypothetical protein [Pseudomonadales bacterium]HJN53260.1 hypothetical protein [Pseudomonadales bacterium]|tara:strand:- start:7442 stop:7981 length:540 start_codon:yes stop_codon:yes gene_type:complete